MNREVEILFTHDLHSRFDTTVKYADDRWQEWGGFARIKTILDERRKKEKDCLVVDAGDFSMGTLYQTIYQEEASELKMLGMLGIDITTMGNHEFDYHGNGFADMLCSAHKSGAPLPCFVISNIDWKKSDGEEALMIKQALEVYGAKEYCIIEKNGLKIAVFGLMGRDAADCAPLSGLIFKDPVEASKKIIARIRREEKADMIVCLSHGGTWENKQASEDELLAFKVPEIDLIISGHSHRVLTSPLAKKNTYIVSSGEYGKYIGLVRMAENDWGRFDIKSYELLPVDETIPADTRILQQIKKYRNLVEENYLSRFGYRFDQVLCVSSYSFQPIEALRDEIKESPLGNLIADSYIYAMRTAFKDTDEKIDLAIIPSGAIRDTIEAGPVTVSDVFDISSLGIGEDNIPGYPLVCVYLYGKEIKAAAEVDASIAPFMSTAQLYMSGLSYEINKNRLIFNKATNIRLVDEGLKKEKIRDNKLYRVVAGLYTVQMLGLVKEKSHGILSITPRDQDGHPIRDYKDMIVRNDRGEMKEWIALASYLTSFPKKNGIPSMPDYYQTSHNRKVQTDSRKPSALLKEPNKVGMIVYTAAASVLAIAALLRIKKGKDPKKK